MARVKHTSFEAPASPESIACCASCGNMITRALLTQSATKKRWLMTPCNCSVIGHFPIRLYWPESRMTIRRHPVSPPCVTYEEEPPPGLGETLRRE